MNTASATTGTSPFAASAAAGSTNAIKHTRSAPAPSTTVTSNLYARRLSEGSHSSGSTSTSSSSSIGGSAGARMGSTGSSSQHPRSVSPAFLDYGSQPTNYNPPSKVQLKESYLATAYSQPGFGAQSSSSLDGTPINSPLQSGHSPASFSSPRSEGGGGGTAFLNASSAAENVNQILSNSPEWRITDPEFDTYMHGLNPSQREAVLAPLQPLLILASAGSGKTKTLISRLTHCLRKGVPASSVLAITFTRKATLEIQDRVCGQIGLQASTQITVCNFHQLALRILRRYYVKLGFTQPFLLIGANEQRQHVRQAVELYIQHKQREQFGTGEASEAIPDILRKFEDKRLKALIDRARIQDEAEQALIESALGDEAGSRPQLQQDNYDALSQFDRPTQALPIGSQLSASSIDSGRGGDTLKLSTTKDGKQPTTRQLVDMMVVLINDAKRRGLGPLAFEGHERAIFGIYNDLLAKTGAIDFSDLVPMAVKLLQDCPDVREECRRRFRYIFVDEFQDISREQWKFLKILLNATDPKSCPAITCVGDDDQAIFRFRGGSGYSFATFVRTFEGRYRVIPLLQTYRSTSKIVSAASSLVSHNTLRYPKMVWTANPSGVNIQLICAVSLAEEAILVANEMERLHKTEGIPYGQMAILSRTRAVLKPFQEEIKIRNLCSITSTSNSTWRPVSREIFSASPALDVLAYVDLVAAGGDLADDAFKRVLNRPARKLGPRVLAMLERGIGANGITSLLAEAHRVVTKDDRNFNTPQREQLASFLRTIRLGRLHCKALDAQEFPHLDAIELQQTKASVAFLGATVCAQLTEVGIDPELLIKFILSHSTLPEKLDFDSFASQFKFVKACSAACVIALMVAKVWGVDCLPDSISGLDHSDPAEPNAEVTDRKRTHAESTLHADDSSEDEGVGDTEDEEPARIVIKAGKRSKKQVKLDHEEKKAIQPVNNGKSGESSSSSGTEKSRDSKTRLRLVSEAFLLRAVYYGRKRVEEISHSTNSMAEGGKGLLPLRKELVLFAAQCRDSRETENYVAESNRLARSTEESQAAAQRKNASVTLSTIHQAKGLEWTVVFFVHVNAGHIPCGIPHAFASSSSDSVVSSNSARVEKTKEEEKATSEGELVSIAAGSEAESKAVQAYLEKLKSNLMQSASMSRHSIVKRLLEQSKRKSHWSETSASAQSHAAGFEADDQDDDDEDDSAVILRLLQRLYKRRKIAEEASDYDGLWPESSRGEGPPSEANAEDDLFLDSLSDDELRTMLNEAWAREMAARMEEERRLAYVACTRARERLYITHAMNENESHSIFVDELPRHLVSRDAPLVGKSSGKHTEQTSNSVSAAPKAGPEIRLKGVKALYLANMTKKTT